MIGIREHQLFVFKKIGSVSCLAEPGIKPVQDICDTTFFLNRVPDNKDNVGLGNTDPV